MTSPRSHRYLASELRLETSFPDSQASVIIFRWTCWGRQREKWSPNVDIILGLCKHA